MHATWLTRAIRNLTIAGLLSAALGVTVAHARPGEPGQPRRPRARNLFASATLDLTANRVLCFLNSNGETCSAGSSPVGGGGFWPQGTVDQYIFNTGLQLAGRVAPSATFPWAGDTIGAFFFDARGDQFSGDPLSGGIFNSTNPGDLATWPNGGIVRDAAIFNQVLLNRPSVSQQDSWVRYWEGDPSFLGGRTHPMGVVVDQRSMAWNYPTGNEHIVYFMFTFYNVTARSSTTAYDNPTIDPAIRNEIAAIGDRFQDLNEARFGIGIPDGGYPIEDMYAAFAADMDVADFEVNYSTAVLPFNVGLTYAGDFLGTSGWTYPPDIFGAPFAAAPGFVGVKYLRSPESSPGNFVGLTMFSNTTNGLPFPDPRGVEQLYRYLSGYVGPADQPCTFTDPAEARARKLCFLSTQARDARFFQASGPFVLPPGESRTIIVAYVHGAPLAAPLAALAGGGIGGDNAPGLPWTGDSIFTDPNKVRPIDRVMGWVSESDLDGDAVIEERGDSGFEIQTAPRSLLANSLVAQAVYESGFLLPFSPQAPEFYLVPGDNQVTVVWQASASETVRPGGGDPYFDIASDNNSPLYDPNFNQYDVEGYRVYRGRSASQLELVAQFDYAGTALIDYTGGFDYGSECAPELGVTTGCPSTDFATSPVAHDLTGHVIQVPEGGRVQLVTLDALVLESDTAVSGGAQCVGPTGKVRCPELANTGVPFAFLDQGVRNSFTYFYAVTAFDVNSLASGPTSLESGLITKRVTPRKPAANQVLAQLNFGVFGDDGTELNAGGSWTIDPATGRFTGPPPPTAVTQLAASFAPLVEQLLPALDLEFIIDSVHGITAGDRPDCVPVENIQGICAEFFVTFTRGTTSQSFSSVVPWPIWEAFGGLDATIGEAQLGAFPVAADSASAVNLGVPDGFAQFNAAVLGTFNRYIRYSAHEGQQSRRLRAQFSPSGSRWFEGADETLDDPAYSLRVGRLTGVDTIYAPLSHVDIDPAAPGVQNYNNLFAGNGNVIRTLQQCAPYSFAMLGRQADIEVTWAAGGTIASVRDVTHHVDVPFRAVPDGSYGFLNDFNGNGKIDWQDMDRVEKVAQAIDFLGFCYGTDPGPGNRSLLLANPVIASVSTAGQPSVNNGTLADLATTGTGFGMYINGQIFIFQLTGGTPPAAGTTWTLRSYAGTVDASAATRGTTNPDAYVYTPIPGSPAIPNLRIQFNVAAATSAAPESSTTLANVHTVPDPYYVSNSLEVTANSKILKFVNLPPQAIIRIYSVSGVLVDVVAHDDPGLGGEATWDLRNRNNQFVASGVYFYHVETPSGQTKVGRFTIVNFAP